MNICFSLFKIILKNKESIYLCKTAYNSAMILKKQSMFLIRVKIIFHAFKKFKIQIGIT